MAVRMDRSFQTEWTAEALAARPIILPKRHFVYPVEVDEVERGALELMVRPAEGETFLATCALGFASPAVPRSRGHRNPGLRTSFFTGTVVSCQHSTDKFVPGGALSEHAQLLLLAQPQFSWIER